MQKVSYQKWGNGGTYAQKDIAFEFASWVSSGFKLYLIKEFQRLKEDENNRLKLEWNLQRTLAKVNYHIHTDAIKEKLRSGWRSFAWMLSATINFQSLA